MASIQLFAVLIIAAMLSFGSCLPVPNERERNSTGPTWNWVNGILASGGYAVSKVHNKLIHCIYQFLRHVSNFHHHHVVPIMPIYECFFNTHFHHSYTEQAVESTKCQRKQRPVESCDGECVQPN